MSKYIFKFRKEMYLKSLHLCYKKYICEVHSNDIFIIY
jgi:hypothetical protein